MENLILYSYKILLLFIILSKHSLLINFKNIYYL